MIKSRFIAAFSIQFLVMTAVLVSTAEEIELVNLPTPLEQIGQPFPMDLSSVVLSSDIKASPIEGQPVIDQTRVATLIDTDRTTGVTFDKKGEYRFLINFSTINRMNAITLTGNLEGATATIEVTELPIEPGVEGWTTVFSGKMLNTPASASAFRPQAAFRALVTINTAGAQDAVPTLSDIAFYATPDHREYELIPNPDKQVKDKKQIESDNEKFLVNKSVKQDEFDLASMYSGARVSHVSSAANLEEANHINDGNAETIWQFDSKEKDSVAVIDLGQSRRVRKISMVHSQKPGQVNMYVVDQLPWEQDAKTTKVAWLNSPMLDGSTLSDVPFLAQLGVGKPPAKDTSPTIIQVQSEWFEKMVKFGGAASDGDHFSQISGPTTEGRYVIVRFLNNSQGASDGFQIHDINVFGDYEKDDFILVQKEFGEPLQEALINQAPPVPVVPEDLIKTRLPPPPSPPAPPPPPASP